MSVEPASHIDIPPNHRLIVALDVPNADAARSLVEELGDVVQFYKIGLELSASGSYFELLDWLVRQDKRVFADLKLYDVPATVAAAVRQISNRGASFLTVHGDRSIMEAAASEKGHLQILAVTVLTSMDSEDLRQMGIGLDVQSLVVQRANMAMATGCDGVIASGLEAAQLRETLGPEAIIVTPGIRPASGRTEDDQKRIVTPGQALENGASFIVVGRPIRNSPNPRQTAEAIQAEISATLQ